MLPVLALLGKGKSIAIIVAVTVALGGAYWKGYKDRGAKELEAQIAVIEEWNRKLQAEVKKNLKLSHDLELAKAKVRVVKQEVVRYVTKEIEKPVYRECIIPPSGVSALNKAADSFNRERKTIDSKKPSGKM